MAMVLVAFLTVLLILWWVDYEAVIHSLKVIDLKILLGACLMQVFTIFLITKQWEMMGREVGVNLPLKKLLHVNMAGTFVESVTPSVKAGGEATKVYLLRTKCNISIGQATAMVGLQKAASLTAFVLINLVSILWFFMTVGFQGAYGKLLLGSFLFLLLFLMTLILFMKNPAKIKGLINLFLSKKLQSKVSSGLESFRENVKIAIKNKGIKAFLKHLSFAVFIWLFFAIKAYIISRGLSLDLSFGIISVITYLTYMIAMVPLLPGGLGTFEGSMVFLLNPFNVALHQGMALALLVRFVTFWFVFLLSCIYLGCQLIIDQFMERQLKNSMEKGEGI